MKINYFQKGGTQLDLNRLYIINSAQASGNYDDLRKMIEGDGSLYNLNAKQRYISNGGTEAGFDRMNQLADEVYANFIKNNPIDTSFLKPIQREQAVPKPIQKQQAVVKPATDWNKVAQSYNFADTSAVEGFQKWVNDTYGPNTLAVDGKIGNMTKGALEKYGQEYYNYLNPVQPEQTEQEKAYALKMLGLNASVPSQTQSFITKATMPFYDNNGQVMGEKTMYYGRGLLPKGQTSQGINNLPQTPAVLTKPVSKWQNIWQSMAKPLPSMSAPYGWHYKKGGKMNYFQQGGQMQQDPVGQVIQGLLQDPQGTMQALSQMQGQQGGKEQVNAILQEIVKRAKSGDQQAAQAIQVLQQAMQGGQQAAPQQAPAAKNGAKLNYLKQLKGKCPEGEELVYMKKGGFVCGVCKKKKLEEGAKVNRTEFFKKDTKKPLDKCGGKMKAKKK